MKSWAGTRTIFRLTIGLGLILSLANCTDEKKIFVERPFFTDPPPAAQGFLGYDDVDAKLTVCGNCHIGHQTKWVETAHAGAWATLQNSGHATGACENCHSVGPNGNTTTGDVGYAGAREERYHDVQCESCHGPGLNHVTNPDASQPLASIKVSADPLGGCAECHSGVHHPFVEEWKQSRHAEILASPAGRAECISCHTAQGALQAWGVTTDYKEKNAPLGQHEAIVCAVCHDPHANTNAGQLRHPIDVADEERNLCMKCHHKRALPETESASIRGPHSPEGPLLLGDAGWWPPGFEPEIDRIVSSHGTTGNPKLCAGCHVNTFPVNDPTTGAFVIQATGHLFEAIPCLDEQGRPTTNTDCALDRRYFAGCAKSGCHLTAEAATSAYLTAKNRIADLVEELDGLLAQVPSSEFNLNDGRFTTADGAWFNARLGELKGSSTHNPFLMENLLVASIDAVTQEYHLAKPAISLELMLRKS